VIEYEKDRLKALIDELFDKFMEVKSEMEHKVKNQKKYYERNSIYMTLKYCYNDDCIFCPHSYEWKISYKLNTKQGKKWYGKRIGRRITHKVLKQYGKDNMYPVLKELENEMRELQKERDFYAKNIQKIRRIYRESQKVWD